MNSLDYIPTKTCTKCGKAQPISEFTKDKQKADGLRPSCKTCKHERSVTYYQETHERQRAYGIAWAAANPDKKKAGKKRHYDRHSKDIIEKTKAWQSANQEKVKAYELERYWRDPEAAKARAAKFRSENPKHVFIYSAKYREENRDKVKEATRAWQAKNPEKTRVHSINRRLREKVGGKKLSSDIIEKLYKLQQGRCPCCGKELGDDFHVDHYMPLALGGLNDDSNVQLMRSV